MANNSSLSKYRKQKAANSVLSKYKEQKKKQEENDITLNTSDDSFTLSRYREMKKNNQINYNTDIINRYFTNSSNYINDVQNNISNPSYSWAKTFSDSETYGNIKNDSDYVRLYIDSLKGTENYDSLKKQYDDYNNALSQYNDAAKQANEFASLFPDEEHYNKAIENIKNSESDFEKNSKYAAYMDKDSSTIDEKKILDYFSNANNNLSDPQNFISKSQNNYNGNEILKYWETQDRLRNMQNVDTVPTESQAAQYQEDSDMLFNQSMEEKYKNKSGADEYDYDKLMEAYNSTDNYREKEWLLEKSEEVGLSEDLQKRYDELQSQYNADYEAIMNSDKSDESKAQEVAKLNEESPDLKDLKDQIESKKYEEKKKSEYDDVVANDVKAKTIMQKYYYLEKYDEIQKMLNSTGHGIESIKVKSSLDAYNFANKLSNEEKEQIRKDFNSLKNKDTLYKYYKREREEQETAEENQILIDYSDEHPVLGSLASVGLNTYGSVGDTVEYVGAGVDKAFGGDGYINPDSTNVAKAQLIRENVSEDMGDVGKFLYNTGMSVGDTVARMPLLALPGGKAMSLSMGGTSSAVSWANDVINSGGSLEDALLTGAAAGAAEIIFEKIPLDNLIKLKNEGTESVWKAVAKQMSIEGMEEVGTDIANAITDQIINGDMSQLALQYQNYLDQGYTESEAWHNTAVDFAMQVGQSFAGGALSGGVLGGGALGANYATNKIGNSKAATNIKSGKAIKENENVNSLIESAKKLSADSKAYKLAEQLEERQKNNKNISSSKVGQLRSLILEQSQTEYDDTYKKATENLHDDEKAIVDKLIREESLSNDEIKILSDNDVLKNSIADLREKQDSLYKSKLNAAFSPFEIIGDNTDEIDESKLNVSDNGKTQINNKEYDGPMEVVKTNPTAGTVTYKIEKDGKSIEVNSDDVQFKSKEEAKLNALASKYNVKTAQKFLDLYENGQNVNEYSEEFDLYQGYGKLATELTDDKLNKGYLLNNEQKIGAYEAGLDSRKSYYQQQNIIADNAKNSKYYAYTKGKFNASAIKDMKLNDTQRAFYDFFREFALRTGINIELFASEDAYGKYQGEQGSWDKNTKTVRIDINAGLKSVDEKGKIKHGMLNTFAHELTHIAEEGNYYDELHKAVVAALEKSSGKSYDELVESKKDELIRSVPNAKAMSDERFTYLADVEVIADACETMLKDSKIFEDIAKGNPTLAQKLRDALKNFIERLKQLLDKINALTSEGKFLEECVDEYEGILNLWDKAVTDGIKTVNAVEAEQKNNTSEGANLESGIKFNNRESYPYSMQTVIKEYLGSVNSDILQFVRKVENGNYKFKRLTISNTSQKQIADIKKLLNIDVTGYQNAISTSGIEHIIKRHGKDGQQDHSMSNDKDIARMKYVIDNYDDIEVLKGDNGNNVFSESFMDKNNNPMPMIRFRKKINGTYYLVEAVGENKYKKIWIVSAYISKRKGSTVTQVLDANIPKPNVQNDLASPVLPKDSLSQENDDVKYQFGGRKAATANKSLLDEAIEMEDSGKDSETIRKKTGWFKSYDGKWRFEIDDSEMQFKSATKENKEKVLPYKKKVLRRMDLHNAVLNNTATAEEKKEYNDIEKYISEYETSKKLDDYVTHPKLFEAYPQLKDVSLYFDILVPNTAAKYYPYSNKIMINAARSDKEQKQSLIHEIQHIIQEIEGFASGSSVEHWLAKGADKWTAYNNYIDTAGEIEARDSASRKDLNAEQRKNTRPDIDRLARDVVFAEEEKVSVGNTTDDTSDIRYQARNTKPDYNFSKALSKEEKARFESALKNNSRGLLIGDNGVLLIDYENTDNYKLICYNGDKLFPEIKSVYKIEGFDYNINNSRRHIIDLIVNVEKESLNGRTDTKTARTILQNFPLRIGEVFKIYNKKTCRYNTIGRGKSNNNGSNREDDRFESDRAGISEDVGQGVSDRRIEDDSPQFQMRPDGGFSNRMLLAEALEKAAKNQLEKNKVAVYKQAVEQIAELETRLNDVNQKIKKVSSVKAAERTREQRTELMKLNNVKKVLQDKVVRKDRQLLNLEAMDTIKNLIEAEKKKAVHEARVSHTDDFPDIRYQARKNINNSDYTKIDLSTLDSKKLKMYNSRGWANALFTKEDMKLLNEKFGELDNRINSKTDNMLGDGSRIVEVNNKIVLIGGTFEEPEIYCVLAINADNETEATDLKEVVFYEYKNYRRNKETLQSLFQYVQSCEKDVRTYRAEDFYYTKGQKDYGERAVLPSNFKNYGYTGEKQNRAGSNPKTGQGISDEQLKDNIKFSRRYFEYGGTFNKALNNKEWASFYSSLEKSNQRNSFRIGDNGILIPDENNSKNYKLVCYEGDSSAPYITAVYKLENYDYNIHDDKADITGIIIRIERDGYNDKQARTILQYYTSLHGSLLERYNSKSGRFVKLTRKSVSNRENDRLESDRAGISQDVGQGVSDRRIEDDSPKFQMRSDGGFINRMLLAETLEKAAKNQLEKNKAEVYKRAVEQITELETKLNDVNQKIKKVSSVKASERNREQRTELMKLNNVKKVLRDKVVRKDRQLLNLEAMDTIKNLIEAEKKKAVHEARVSHTDDFFDIRCQARNIKPDYNFSRALSKEEKARFESALKNNSRGLLIGDNGVLLIDYENTDNYKLICYNGDKLFPEIKSVYKIEGFDYNINNSRRHIIDLIVKFEKENIYGSSGKRGNGRTAYKILQDLPIYIGEVFRKYNIQTRRFNTLIRGKLENLDISGKNDREKQDRTGVSQDVGRDISDRIIEDDNPQFQMRPDTDRLAQNVVFAEDEEKVSVGNTTDDTSDIRYQARKNINNSDYTKIDLSTLDSKKLKMYNSRGWANALFTKEDIKLLNEKFGELDNRINSKTDNMLGDGSRIVEVNNKIVLIGGTFEEPEIYCVLAINADNETEAEIYKEWVTNEKQKYGRTRYRYIEYLQSVENNIGKTIIRTYIADDFKHFKGSKDTGERAILPSNFQNYGYTGEKQNRAGSNPKTGQGVSDRKINDDTLQFQMRPDGGFSNRMLLAETLEKAAKNQLEKNKVSVYKQAVEQIAELETRLNDVNQKIKKVSSVKAAERTREQRTELMKLNNVKKVLRDKVVRKDRQLLNLEAMDTIKNLIEAEKKKAVHEARVSREATLKEIQEKHDKAMSAEKEKNRERLAEVSKRKDKIIIAEREKRRTMVKGVRDARDKKENIRKIKKSLKDIAKLLNRSKAEKTVKQGLRDTVSKMLELSDVLFDTDLSNADIVRRGVGAATPEEQKLLNEYLSLIGETDTELTESQRRKVYQLNSKLKDLFIRERERLNKATVEQSLTQLSESYKSTKNAKENYIRNAFDENIIDAIDNFKDEIGGTLVKDMTVNQTEELRKIVTMMLTSIRKANKIHAENINSDYEQTSIDVINEILNIKDTKELRNIISQKLTDFQWRNFKPVYAFRFIGSKTFEKLFWNLQKGELKWYIDLDEAKKFKENCEKQYNYKSFDFKKKLEFEAADGSAFTLDLNQMMDIYAASRRPQALQHLLKGGFTFEKDSADGKLKVKTGAKAYPLTVSTIQSIADSLSENEKGYAEAMQKYLSEVMAKKGNEVSMALYGVELFNEDTYWSITSSDVFLQVEENKTTGEFKLKNEGFTKGTVHNASNPIVLKGFEENWCNHVNQMSLYHALTLPLEDFTKVFNYNTGVKGNEENSTTVTGVRSVIKGAFGNSAESYIRQFLRDINGGIREASRVGIADNLISLSKKASVFANFSVFIQQPTAILRALAYVDARYFLPEPNKLIRVQNYRKDWEQLKKYAPIAGIKEMGMFDTGTGKGVLEWLSSGQRDSVVKKTRNKIDDIGSWLPEMADKYAWIKLWHAIQRETRAKYGLKIGTEENLVKSGERFNEIVGLTQVYDSVFSRSGAMRSKQTFDKIATSYMAEPTTEMNMAVDAVVQLKRSGKAGIKQFAKTISAILISKFANTLLKSIVFAGRDDDEDETYSDKYWQAVKDDLLGWGSSLNPLNYYPIMRDIMSVFEGYTTERMDMSLVSDLVISIKRLMKEDGTTTDNITDFIGYIANLFGLPVRNIERDIKAAFNTYDTLTTASKDPITSLEMSIPTAYQETYDKYWEDGYTADECRKKAITSVKTKISKKLKPVYLEALKNQDSKTVRNIRQYMNNSGFYKSLNDVDDILKGWRENSDEEEKRAQRAEKRK